MGPDAEPSGSRLQQADGDRIWNAESLFELSPDAQLLVDPQADRVLQANAAARGLLGLDRAINGDVVASRFIGGSMAGLIVFTQAVMERGHGWSNALTCRPYAGHPFRAECHAVRVRIGGAAAMLVALRDLRSPREQRTTPEATAFVRHDRPRRRQSEALVAETNRRSHSHPRSDGEGATRPDAGDLIAFARPPAPTMVFRGDQEHVDDEAVARSNGRALSIGLGGRLPGEDGHSTTDWQLRQTLEALGRRIRRLEQENAYLRREVNGEQAPEIIGDSEAARETTRKIERIAPTNASVLITGEPGTGKRLIARAVHHGSRRREQPLIRLNCAGIPGEHLADELFGPARPVTDGAPRETVGRLQLADGGTLILEQIDGLPPELQRRLKRVLEGKPYAQEGDDRSAAVDVRIIATSDRALDDEVAAGRFCPDLLSRLNLFPIASVPLRRRPGDILPLASHFVRQACRQLGIEELALNRADERRLQAYGWPGNVRELKHLLERAVILARGGELRLELPTPANHEVLSRPGLITEPQRRQRDRDTIRRALEQTGGKVFGPGGAAELLGLKPTTLAARIKRWGVARPMTD